MKFGTLTKLGKKNKTTSQKFDDDVISGNCGAIAIFSNTANLKQSGRWMH